MMMHRHRRVLRRGRALRRTQRLASEHGLDERRVEHEEGEKSGEDAARTMQCNRSDAVQFPVAPRLWAYRTRVKGTLAPRASASPKRVTPHQRATD